MQALPRFGLFLRDDFDGQLVEGEFAAVADFKCRAEGRIVLLERFKNWREFVLKQSFDFVVAEFALVEYLRNSKTTLWVHAHVSGMIRFAISLVRCPGAKTQLVSANGAG